MVKLKKKTKKIMIALCVVVGAAIFLFTPTLFTTDDPFSTPPTFQPIQTTRVAFDVFTMTDPVNPIGSIVVGESPSAKFSTWDPASQISTYPRVGVFRSNAPYISDAAGNYVGQESILTTEKRVFDDVVLFRHEAFFTYDFGARTFTALPAARTDTLRQVTPVAGMSVAPKVIKPTTDPNNIGWVSDSPQVIYAPRGTMILSVDKGHSPWRISAVGTAAITQSLEPINYEEQRAGTPTTGLTFADAINRLKANYGNTPVVVRPRITISAVNNFESYSYTQTATLSNGTGVTMTLNTTNALVGFEGATYAKAPWAGKIPKAYSEQFDAMDYSEPEGDAGGEYDKDMYEFSEPMSASFYYTGDVSLPGGNEITRLITPVDAWTSLSNDFTPNINWNEILAGRNSLPEQIDLCAEMDLQPSTTIRVANMRATGTIKTYDYFNPVDYQNYDVSYQYPYALKIDNVAVMYSCTIKVDLFTRNEVQMVTSSGLPVDINSLVDFDLGSVIGNPNADNMRFTVDSVQWWEGFLGMFEGMFGQIIQVIAIVMVIVIVIGVIYVIAQFKKNK